MRDPKRIKRILDKIEIIWTKYPDLRLNQLIYYLTPRNSDALYSFEDDKFENALDAYISHNSYLDLENKFNLNRDFGMKSGRRERVEKLKCLLVSKNCKKSPF